MRASVTLQFKPLKQFVPPPGYSRRDVRATWSRTAASKTQSEMPIFLIALGTSSSGFVPIPGERVATVIIAGDGYGEGYRARFG
jgi:hypothetical protein